MFRRTAGSMVLTVALTLAASGCSGGSSGGDTDPIPDPDPCTPSSCAFDACGTFSDGCDGTLDCTCAGALVCGGVTPERCAACSADGLCLESVTSTKPGFRAVFGTSPTDVWLVDRGLSGAVFQWDGTGWHDRSSTDVKGGPDQIWGTSPISLWGVSAWGIWRWDGTAWSRPVTTWTNLYAIWGAAEDDVWAVGAGGLILHYDGTAWAEKTSPTTSALYDVWAGAANDAWAVGGSHALLHWDGESWSKLTSVSTSISLNEVQGVGPGEALVLDSDGSIALWNGTELVSHGTGQQGDAYAFWSFGKDDVWSAGFYGTVEHYDGTTWTDVERSTTSDLFAVWGAPNGDVWIPVLNREVLRRKAP
jgi:hypothetical protein